MYLYTRTQTQSPRLDDKGDVVCEVIGGEDDLASISPSDFVCLLANMGMCYSGMHNLLSVLVPIIMGCCQFFLRYNWTWSNLKSNKFQGAIKD
jgi:hypothetical protein